MVCCVYICMDFIGYFLNYLYENGIEMFGRCFDVFWDGIVLLGGQFE